ncbi:PLP-dependent aminotransferase family protein [Planctomonas sp. JC2975]|uniref:aminotransferase-like domain-containing protein n=1 Tax=Planctomonas sp. JC2975 TaxID=2729626 RepID=UPI001473B249|nr:PLP-dependent aminotransferase family protein [Planctomonas sp. JC2975]NNC13738.1 PLP-dependent aminotransferase family protein [Planctomonas sp. JC2975]
MTRVLGQWRGRGPTLVAALQEAVSAAVLDGQLARGTPLPSERSLAAALGVSRVTVTAAYDALRAAGWIRTTPGAGSEVQLPDWLDARVDASAPRVDGAIDLTLAAPGAPLPVYLAALARATERLLRHARSPRAEALPGLAEAIADRYTRGGLATRPEQVLVTTGSGASLALLARRFLRPGVAALVESPTYPGALDLLRSSGARVVGWPVSRGWDPEQFQQLLRRHRPAVVYLILDFHNPTGALATAAQRRELAQHARAAGARLVLDQTMADLDLRGPDAAAMPNARDGAGTFRIGSMAKTVWAGLRVGWLRGPATDIRTLNALPETYYFTPPTLEQLTALELFDGLDDLIVARRQQLREQRATLLSVLESLPQLRLTQEPLGGLSAWLELSGQMSSATFARHAPQLGLRLLPGGRFSADGTLDRYLRLPFSLPQDTLVEAGRRLGDLLQVAER